MRVPSFLYHPTDAPNGRKFTNQDEYDIAVECGWVDTPAKFSPAEAETSTDDAKTSDRWHNMAVTETLQ